MFVDMNTKVAGLPDEMLETECKVIMFLKGVE
jgi:hypothetical protein